MPAQACTDLADGHSGVGETQYFLKACNRDDSL
jgi:hypothetical protein